ncbi:MAG: ribonuclease Z [Candidatus Hecatellales archaeon]|nr:MAG: ribonuclease Z [Candidatus Hecatellales archaeon]
MIFLGTSAGIPSVERSLPSVVLRYGGWLLLFDCGEGTQRQMMKAKVGFMKPMKIFITHLHGDHVFGLLGLLQTMNLLGRERRLEIYGPKGIRSFLEAAVDHSIAELKFPLEIREIRSGTVVKEKDFRVRARKVCHSIPTYAYSFEEYERPGKFHVEKALKLGVPRGPLWSRLQQGKPVRLPDGRLVKPEEVLGPSKPGIKIVYSGDTKPCKALLELSENADLLIHECTFDDSLAEKAESEFHSTPGGAAQLAKEANVKSLILTHISTRYQDASILLEQARKVFPRVKVAEDFMKVEL